MRFMRRTVGVNLRDRVRSEDIKNNIGVMQVMKGFKGRSIEHVERMESHQSPKMETEYAPTTRRTRGRPRKTLMDTFGSSKRSTPMQRDLLAYAQNRNAGDYCYFQLSHK